jgi:L-alanine-DL-glutamate epimerase-like enolase superfamily enzyme
MDDDVRRIKLAFDVVAKGKRVMVDSNQVFNRNEAQRRGRVYEQMGCFWFEEPLPPHDMEGFAELA